MPKPVSSSHIITVALLLLVQYALRLHNLLALDPYIDEGLHIARALRIWDFAENPGRFSQGKLLLYFWLGLFETQPHADLFSARFGMVLFSLISGAVVYLLGRLLRNHLTGLLALGLYLILPMSFFYERLAMADPFAAGLAGLVAWRSWVFARRPRLREGLVLGLLLALATMAKLTMGLLPGLPVVAALLYYPWRRGNLRQQLMAWLEAYLTPLALAAVIVLLMWTPLAVPAYFARNTDDPFVLVNDFNIQSDDRDQYSILEYLEGLYPLIDDFTHTKAHYWLLALLLGWLTARIYRQGEYRTMLFLGAWLLLTCFLTVAMARLISSRYFVPAVAPVVLFTALMIESLWSLPDARRWIALGAGLMIAWWGLSFALPFMQAAWDDPFDLPIERTNYTEYLSGYLSGDQAVRDAAAEINRLQPRHVYATWNVCDILYFYINSRPTCMEYVASASVLRDHLRQDLAAGESGYLVITGYRPFFQAIPDLQYEEVRVFEREKINRPVTIWRLWWGDSAGQADPSG